MRQRDDGAAKASATESGLPAATSSYPTLILGKDSFLTCKIRMFGELNHLQGSILISVERRLWGGVTH